MVIRMIRIGKKAKTKCERSFKKKAKIMRGKKKAIINKGEEIKKKSDTVKKNFEDASKV